MMGTTGENFGTPARRFQYLYSHQYTLISKQAALAPAKPMNPALCL